MQLKSLEISGFKSFADKTHIDFQKGMTGIVGPNGSGKSNIIEAIRWVLGEQAVKSLRGTKMADVIFAGSQNRAPLNMARVSITFDNHDHYLNSDFTELTITRKLFRNGDSEYLINNQNCRLKDITDLLIDTGMGKESFSIISQGRVEAIFNSKPEDRRAIIEDVAGVLKYKKDKQQTENKLAETTDYLDRVQDIIAELADQVEPLEKQASLATDYLDQKHRFDQYDRSRIVKQVVQTRAKKKTADQQFQQANKLFTQYKKRVHAGQIELDQHKHQLHQLQTEKDQLSSQNLELTRRLENTQGKQGVDNERLQNRHDHLATLEQAIKDQEQSATDHQAKIADLQAQIASQAKEMAQVSDQVKQLELLTSPEGKAKLNSQLEQLQDQYVDQMQQQATLRNTGKYLTKSQTQSNGQNDRTQAELTKLQAQVKTQSEHAQQLEDQLAAAQSASAEQQQALKQQRAAYSEAQQKQDFRQQNWLDALGLVKKAQSQLEALTAIADNYQNFYAGVRSVLQHRQEFPGIRGAVSELIDVPAEYTRAITIALGGQLQNIICDNQATAKAAVQFLTRHRLGRATFLPIDRIHGHQISTAQLAELQGADGLVGVAAELVSTPTDLQSVNRFLLGNVLIVQDLDAGIRISKIGHLRVRIVTLAGEVINASGSITGGATKHDDNGVLQQNQRRSKLATDIQTMQAELTKQEQAIAASKAELGTLTTQGQTMRATVEKGQSNVLALKNQVDNEREKATTLSRQLQALKYEQNQQTNEQADYQEQVTQNQQALAKISSELTATAAQVATTKDQIANYETTQESQAGKLREQREWLAATKQVHKQLGQNLAAEQTALQESQQQQAAKQTELTELQHQVDQQQLSQGQRKQLLATLSADQTNVQKQLTANQIELADLEGWINDADQGQTRQQQLADAAGDDYRRSELQQTRLSSEIDHYLKDLSEKYQQTFEAASSNVSELSLADLEEQLKLLKMGLDEIGTVNLGAIDEYQRVSKRYTFLQGQAADLTASKEHLLTAMDEMDTTVKERFEKSFNQVAAEFAQIFGQMFGGGKAKLILTDPDNMLTTGIDIMAQPPGKKFQRLSLLSGGEKALTAITLLFAILAVRPVPFSILDEAEAALDDANVDRFSQYLRNFRGATQFVVITHRKGTMMNANVLYGVTMEESGVSKMVSVSLDEAVAQ